MRARRAQVKNMLRCEICQRHSCRTGLMASPDIRSAARLEVAAAAKNGLGSATHYRATRLARGAGRGLVFVGQLVTAACSGYELASAAHSAYEGNAADAVGSASRSVLGVASLIKIGAATAGMVTLGGEIVLRRYIDSVFNDIRELRRACDCRTDLSTLNLFHWKILRRMRNVDDSADRIHGALAKPLQ
jgi:hypothetical protein